MNLPRVMIGMPIGTDTLPWPTAVSLTSTIRVLDKEGVKFTIDAPTGCSVVQWARSAIAEIVSAKPEERRILIEEAAGIGKYKARRREAESKIESTRQNLLRVNDDGFLEFVAFSQTDGEGRCRFGSPDDLTIVQPGTFVVFYQANQYIDGQTEPFSVGADEQVDLGDIGVQPFPVQLAAGRICELIPAAGGPCRYVVTPNVDHAVMYQHSEPLRQAYADASLVLADGMPVLWASRLLRRPLPQRVPGSDLVPALFGSVGPTQRLRVFLLGAAPGVAERAAVRIEQRWPQVSVAGTYSPPLGFDRNDEENQQILERIYASRPDVLVVGLPRNMDGSEGPSAALARALGEKLAERTGLPVAYWDERLTTREAQRALLEADVSRARRRKVIDQVAAALILQGWLDAQAHAGGGADAPEREGDWSDS